MTETLRNKRVTVMGLGRHGGGVAVTRWLAAQGCRVTVTDCASHDELSESLEQIQDLPLAGLTIGRHNPQDFLTAEVLVVNPAVKPGNRWVEDTRRRGALITSEVELFLNRCPATVVGVTGTTGKSTTATMLARILEAAERRCWLGGNIGVSLLDQLETIRPEDIVVLELSSFQLAQLSDNATMPAMAIITNCSPNHLDWHGTWEAYTAAKRRILRDERTVKIIDPHNPVTASWLPGPSATCHFSDDDVPPLSVCGTHNRSNARLAATAAQLLDTDLAAINKGRQSFRGLPHRLQHLGDVADRQFIDDSKATSPAAAIAALRAMDRPTWLLAGGFDTGADLGPFAAEVVRHAKGAACFGGAADRIVASLREEAAGFLTAPFATLGDAVNWAFEQSSGGETLLLSPGLPSFGEFRDFQHRGWAFQDHFQRLCRTNRA